MNIKRLTLEELNAMAGCPLDCVSHGYTVGDNGGLKQTGLIILSLPADEGYDFGFGFGKECWVVATPQDFIDAFDEAENFPTLDAALEHALK